MATPRFAPLLDPQAVACLQRGRVPVSWRSGGHCAQCGWVLLPGDRRDYGELLECPWCLVRQQGQRLPSLAFVRARWRELGMPVLATAQPPCHVATTSSESVAAAHRADSTPSARADREPVAIAPEPSSSMDAGGTPADFPTAVPLASPPDAVFISHIDDVPHHPLDTGWIKAQLATVTDPGQRMTARQRYGAVYQAACDAEPDPIRQEGRARLAANTDLREWIERARTARLRRD